MSVDNHTITLDDYDIVLLLAALDGYRVTVKTYGFLDYEARAKNLQERLNEARA